MDNPIKMKQTHCAHCLARAKLHKTYVRAALGEKKEREYLLCMDCSLAFKRGETPLIELKQKGYSKSSKRGSLDYYDSKEPAWYFWRKWK